MKEKLAKTRNELERQYGINSGEISKLEEKIKVLKRNLIEGKFWIFFKSYVGSFMTWLILTPIILSIAPNILSNIIGTNPLHILRYLFIVPIIPAVIAERTISKIDYKKLNRFTGAKTDEEKREEICEYELAKEKIEDKNHAISRAYEFAADLETKLDVCNVDFGNSNLSKEEQETKKEKLSENIKNKEKELEILSTQNYLNDNFIMLRSKYGKLGTMAMPILVGFIASMYGFLGTIIVEPSFAYESPATVGRIVNSIALGTGAIGTTVASVATYLRRKQDRRIFNKINNRLGTDKLPENIDSETREARKIVRKGNKVIDELATLHLVYEDSKRELGRIIDINDKNPILEHSFKTVQITEKTREEVLSNPERYGDCDVRIRAGKFYTDEEYENYVEESLKRHLPDEKEGKVKVKKR